MHPIPAEHISQEHTTYKQHSSACIYSDYIMEKQTMLLLSLLLLGCFSIHAECK